MAVKGERMSPELKARMAEGRRQARLRKQEARGESRNEPVVPRDDDLNAFDFEDVSLPTGPRPPAEQEPASPPIVGDPSDPYNLWLMVLEPDTRELFTEKELRALFEEQRAKAAAEKKVRRRKEISELALSTARSDLGLLPAQKIEQMRVAQLNAKKVSMIVEMPPAQANGGPADVGLRIDGQVIENGKRHFCTYGEAASIREMLYRHGQHELMFKGENLRYRSYLLGQAMGSVSSLINSNEGNQ